MVFSIVMYRTKITFDKSCVSTSIKIYASYMYSVHTFNHLFVYDRGFFFYKNRRSSYLNYILYCKNNYMKMNLRV